MLQNGIHGGMNFHIRFKRYKYLQLEKSRWKVFYVIKPRNLQKDIWTDVGQNKETISAETIELYLNSKFSKIKCFLLAN